MNKLLFSFIIFFTSHVYAETYNQRLFLGDTTKIVDFNGDNIVVSCQNHTPSRPDRPPQMETELVCTANCIAGNNSAYNTKIEGYINRQWGNHSDEMYNLCLSSLPNQVQRTGSYITELNCRSVEVNVSSYTCSATCVAGNNSAYNNTVTQIVRRRSSERVWKKLMTNCLYSLPDHQKADSYLLDMKCE